MNEIERALSTLQDRLKLMNKPLEGYQETLRKAREEVQNALDNYELVGEHEYDISEHLQIALAEIDKAIGDETGGKKRD